jgi:hypothetical protein
MINCNKHNLDSAGCRAISLEVVDAGAEGEVGVPTLSLVTDL